MPTNYEIIFYGFFSFKLKKKFYITSGVLQSIDHYSGTIPYLNAKEHYFGRIWKCLAQQSLDILGFLCFIALLPQSFNQYSELMNYWSYFFVLDTFVVPLSSERIAVVHMFNTPKSYQLNHKTTELMVFNNSYEGMSNEHWGMTENLWFMLLKMDQTEWRMLDVSKQTVYFM